MSADSLSRLYGLELLYAERPDIDQGALLRELRARLGSVDPLLGDMLAFVAHDFPVAPQEGVSAALVFIAVSTEPFDPATAQGALEQTWNWPAAGSALPQAKYSVTLTDMLARPLDPRRRWELVRGALAALLAVAPPVAVHWTPAQKLVDPLSDLDDPLLPVNARLFRVEGRTHGECVMDTVGLHLFGLTDLQCHFVGLDPGDVAAYLLDISAFLLENGPVIEDGQKVAGVGRDEQWTCVREEALVGPPRPVLGIRPSSWYAPR
jgi:hypothetical protein